MYNQMNHISAKFRKPKIPLSIVISVEMYEALLTQNTFKLSRF